MTINSWNILEDVQGIFQPSVIQKRNQFTHLTRAVLWTKTQAVRTAGRLTPEVHPTFIKDNHRWTQVK